MTAAQFRASLVGRACFLGNDLADKIDLAAVVAIFPRPLPRADASAEDSPALTCAIDVLPFFWMPEKTLHRRAQEDGVPYPEWARAGYVTTTPGNLIDHEAIAEFQIGPLSKEFKIRGIGIDQAGAAGVVSKLRRHFGDDLVDEVPQGFRSLSEASKLVEALILTGNLTHDGNPCMSWCVGNMGKEENAWHEIRPVKTSQRKRIDGGVALVDGVWKMTKTPMVQRSIYNTRRDASGQLVGVRTLGS